ncbi:FAD binding domain-containing protein [Mucidula mucida]|nr:FAD binding domain-containing protein [Mucidula mucida]
MSPATSSVDVLIIGAGPAGLMCAFSLAKAGVNVRVIDQRPSKVAAGQADGIQPRTIEVLQSHGLADRLLAEGNQMHMTAFYNPSPDGGIMCVDLVPDISILDARYPFEVTLHQGAIEAIFLDAMRPLGVEIERPAVPMKLQISTDDAELTDPTAYPIQVTIQHLDAKQGSEPEVVRAKFIVGCDGAHSWVRKTLGITMDGEQTQYIWGVIDMVPDTDFPDIRHKAAVHSNQGSCMVIPREGDKVRLYIQLAGSDVIDQDTGRVNKSKTGPRELLDVARKSFRPFTFKDPEVFDWWTIYIIGQRVASRFSVHERVFIAGDACHTHSPKAGQGMNASINDAHNLAWKLTYVLRGWAGLDLLRTYESERRTYAQDLINFDKKFAKLFSDKPRSPTNATAAFKTCSGFTSGIGIHYAESVLVNATHQDCAAHLTVGMRVPPSVILRAADSRPFHIHDVLPRIRASRCLCSPAIRETRDNGLGVKFAKELEYVISGKDNMFDVLSIRATTKRQSFLRVGFIDDVDTTGTQGGHAYKTFGVPAYGAVVVVRPDGYIGMVAPLEKADDLTSYFSAFMSL